MYHGLRFEHFERKLVVRRRVEGQVLVGQRFDEIGSDFCGSALMRTDVNFDIFCQGLALEGKEVVQQHKKVLDCNIRVAGDIEGDAPLNETHLERQQLNYARATSML